MESRELMFAAIEFGGPDRLPICFPVPEDWIESREASDQLKGSLRDLAAEHPQDFEDLSYGGAEGWTPVHREDGQWVDEWGVTWEHNTVMVHPLADWKALNEYVFPDPHAPGRFDTAVARIAESGGTRYLLGRHMSTIFERYAFLRGFEAVLVDHVLYPEEFRYLQSRIMEFSVGLLEEWLNLGVDAVYFGDDFGMQDRLLISPQMFRELYREKYERLMEPMRKAGKHIMFHMDGNVYPLLEDFLELGVRVINPVQKHAMDFEELGRNFKGRLVFWGGIDTQDVLPNWPADRVREEVQWAIRTLAMPSGGYLAKPGHVLLPDMPIENIIAMYEEFINFKW